MKTQRQIVIDLWNDGHLVDYISKKIKRPKQYVQGVLSTNNKYLKREYVRKWIAKKTKDDQSSLYHNTKNLQQTLNKAQNIKSTLEKQIEIRKKLEKSLYDINLLIKESEDLLNKRKY